MMEAAMLRIVRLAIVSFAFIAPLAAQVAATPAAATEQDAARVLDRRLATDPQFAGVFVDFWRGLAHELNGFDAERVLLEPLNEPEIEDRDRWNGLQARLIAAIRSAAPRHTIVACGHRYSDMDELLASDVVADQNVVYNFHFYSPHIFTHQGATWGTPFWRHLRQVPYPAALPGAMPSDDFPLA